MEWKEGLREQGIPEEDISKGLAEAQKALEAEGGPPNLEAIKKRITESETAPVVREPAKPELPNTFRIFVESRC